MKTSVAIVGMIIVAIIAGSGVYGVLLSTQTGTSSSKSGFTSPIKIGVLEPLSGALAGPGKGIVDSIELAALQINATGGIGGQPIKLYIEDVQTDPQTALTDLQTLYSVDGVQVVIGPPTSQQVETVTNYATQNHIVLITSSATAGAISGSSPYIFRTVPSDNLQAAATAAYINAKGYQKVAVVTRNDAFGQGLANSLKQILGSKVVVTIEVTSGQSDYTSQMQQVKAANPDVIFYDEFVADGIVIFKDAVNLGLQNIPTVGGIELYDPSFFQDPIAAQYEFQTNMTGPTPASTTSSAPYVNFANSFSSTFGFAPGLFTGTSYDAAMIAMNSIARADAYNGTAIQKQVTAVSANYVGPSGFLEMNNQGDITQVSYVFFQVVKVNSTSYGFTTFGSYSSATGITLPA